MKTEQIILTVKYNLILLIFICCLIVGCGDMLALNKRITGNYYLIETDAKADLSVCYKTKDGDYIGRIPGSVTQYGFNDSLVVACSTQRNVATCYIIDRRKDSDYAEEKTYLMNIMPWPEFIKYNKEKLHIELKHNK